MKKLIITILVGVCVMNTNVHASVVGDIFGWVGDSLDILSSVTELFEGSSDDSRDIPEKEYPHNVRNINADTLQEITDRYDENSIEAYERYGDKWFSFSGVVDSLSTGMAIKTDQWALLWVMVNDNRGYPAKNGTQCWGNLDPAFAKSLRKGDRIVVTGKLVYNDGTQKIDFTDCQVRRG